MKAGGWVIGAALLGAALFCGCGEKFDYVKIIVPEGSGAPFGCGVPEGYSAERAYLESLFGEAGGLGALGFRLFEEAPGGKGPRAELVVEVLASWLYEEAFGDILVSRTPLVPRDDVLAGRTNTSLEACLGGGETLIPLEELGAPFTALRVDGLVLGDEGYPLIRAAGVRVRGAGDKKPGSRLLKRLRLLEEGLEAAPKPLVQPDAAPVWIVAGGDLMLDRGASEILFREGPAGIFGGTAEMLAGADLALVNLEGVISSRGKKVPKSFNFRFVPETAPALRGAGIDAVLHANNHVYDYGEDAFLDSLSWLGRAGVGVVGAGLNEDEASEPFVLRRGGRDFRVFGIASFPRERNGWDGASAAAGPGRAGMLHASRGGGEKLGAKLAPEDPAETNVVLFHGGVEWSRRPDAATRELYTSLIRAGADLVIGSHPHVVQGFEWVLGKPVFWSLGNYVFGGMENTEGGEEGLFIRLGFMDRRLVYLEPFALTLSHTRTDIAPAEKLNSFYARTRELREQNP